jgi:hypothetical protein
LYPKRSEEKRLLDAMRLALVEKSLKGAMVVVGGLNLGGSIEPVFNASTLVEIAVEKGTAAARADGVDSGGRRANKRLPIDGSEQRMTGG